MRARTRSAVQARPKARGPIALSPTALIQQCHPRYVCAGLIAAWEETEFQRQQRDAGIEVEETAVSTGVSAGGGTAAPAAVAAASTDFTPQPPPPPPPPVARQQRSAAEVAAAAQQARARMAQEQRKAAVLGYTGTDFLDVEVGEDGSSGGGSFSGGDSSRRSDGRTRHEPLYMLQAPVAAAAEGSERLAADEIQGLYDGLAEQELINPEVADREEWRAPS